MMGWQSSSHGAGRRMSRKEAHQNIDQKDFEDVMKDIVCDTDERVKDEAPQAYKDLSVVMNNQKSLTDIVHHLLPLVNVKGIESTPKRYLTPQEKRERLEIEKENIKKGIKKLSGRLQSKKQRVVDQTNAKIAKLKQRAAEIESILTSLSSE